MFGEGGVPEMCNYTMLRSSNFAFIDYKSIIRHIIISFVDISKLALFNIFFKCDVNCIINL